MRTYDIWHGDDPKKLFSCQKEYINKEIQALLRTNVDEELKKIKDEVDEIRAEHKDFIADLTEKSDIVREVKQYINECDKHLMKAEKKMRKGIKKLTDEKLEEYVDKYSYKQEDVTLSQKQKYANTCKNIECMNYRDDIGCKLQQCENVEDYKSD